MSFSSFPAYQGGLNSPSETRKKNQKQNTNEMHICVKTLTYTHIYTAILFGFRVTFLNSVIE